MDALMAQKSPVQIEVGFRSRSKSWPVQGSGVLQRREDELDLESVDDVVDELLDGGLGDGGKGRRRVVQGIRRR